MAYTFLKKTIAQNNPNRPIVALKAHVVHYTGNTSVGANAISHYNYFNSTYVGASTNYFIDDKTVVEVIPPGMEAWHSGGTTYTTYAKTNFNHNGLIKPNFFTIGYEMCVNSDGNFELTKGNTIEFIAKMMIETNCYELIRHYDVTNKGCPLMFTPNVTGGEQAWLDFKGKVLMKVEQLKQPPKQYPTGTPIMGESVLTPYQMVKFVENITTTYKLNCTLLELAELFINEGKIEGVRGDIAFCQSIHETTYFRYGGQVLPVQNNYSGIGATNDSPVGKGAWFDTPQIGVRAQIQHLKAYACNEPLNNSCVDPRFQYVFRGRAPYWEWLGRDENPMNIDRVETDRQGWAAPGTTYGQGIVAIFEKIKLLPAEPPVIIEPPVVEEVIEEIPVVEEPIVEEVPIIKVPPIDGVSEEVPVVDIPVEESPVTEPIIEETPVVEEPTIETPVESDTLQLTEEQKNFLVDLIMKLVNFFVNLFKK